MQCSRWLFIIIIVITVVALAGCGAESAPSAVVYPSPTFDFAPDLTVTPNTDSFGIPLPTVTLAPTSTSRQSAGKPSPTSPLQATHTLMPVTPTTTLPPIQVAESGSAITIEYFITSTENIRPGDDIALFWRVQGATSVRLFRLNDEGRREQVWDVESEGRLTIPTEAEEGGTPEIHLLLRAEGDGQEAENDLVIHMENCISDWFFSPPPEECSDEPALSTFQVEQRFEGGLMIWLESRQEILVLYNDGNTPAWEGFPDTFTEGMPIQDDALIPPDNRLQPVRGFGLVWRENDNVQERLGWALEPELGYDGIIQVSAGTPGRETIYLRIRDGGILRLLPAGGSWEILPAIPGSEGES